MPSKNAYFQGGGGVNEPTPHKKKYKTDPSIILQPRFVEPFYRNYDLYQTEGVDNPLGPGSGWSHINNYTSIADFLSAKRKQMKNKYTPDDSYIEDSTENFQKRKSKMKARAALLAKLTKIAIDFTTDEQINSGSILSDSESPIANSIGFREEQELPENDFEGKDPTQLNFGEDYDGEFTEPKKKPKNLEELIKIYDLSQNMPLIDGIQEEEELTQPNNPNSQYGITDSGNTLYDKISFV